MIPITTGILNHSLAIGLAEYTGERWIVFMSWYYSLKMDGESKLLAMIVLQHTTYNIHIDPTGSICGINLKWLSEPNTFEE